MKKIIHLFLILLAAAALTFCGTGCSAKGKKIYHEKRADKFYDAGQWAQAEIEYLNALRADPQDATLYARLGEMYFDEGRLRRAMYFLSKANDLATNNPDVQIKLGFVNSASGKNKEARAQANFVLDRQPQDPQAPLLLAEAADTPAEIAVAKTRLEKLAAAHDDAELEVALGDLALKERDLKTATAKFQHALSLNPKSPAANSALGSLDWSQGNMKTADTYFKTAADASPSRSPWRIQYARFKIQTGDLAGGREVLENILKETPEQLPALLGIAQIALVQTNFDECQKYIKKILVEEPDDFEALLLDAQLKIQQGDGKGAVAEMERVTKIYPQAARGFYQLALAYFSVNDANAAIDNLNQAVTLNPNFNDAVLLLADAQIKVRNPSRALVLLQQLAKNQPQLVQGQLALADAQREMGHTDEALAIYNALEKKFPNDPRIQLLKGSVLLEQQNYPDARKAFNHALELDTNSLSALEQIVNLDLEEKQFSIAQKRVETELSRRPENVRLHLMLAKVFLTANEGAQAEAELKKTIALAPDEPGAYLLLAQLDSNSGRVTEAVDMLNKALAKEPKNLAGWMLMASIESAQTNYQKAADAYEKILAINPNSAVALNNLAYIYSENLHQLDRAYELAQAARTQLPYDPSTADTLGWVIFQRGDYPAALILLKQSGTALTTNSEAQFHYGMANYMLGNENNARAELQRALQTGENFSGRAEAQLCLTVLSVNPQTADATQQKLLEKRVSEKPDDQIALSRLATIYQRAGQTDKAISTFEAALQANKNNLPATMSLIQLYLAKKDTAKAFDTAKTAYRLAPGNPAVLQMFGKLSFETGDYKNAYTVLAQAVQNQPDNAAAQFDFARAAYRFGKIPETQKALQAALPSLSGAQAAEARRQLDLINAAADPAQAVAAAPQVAQILKSEPNYLPALAAQAVIQEKNGDVNGAIATGEKILELDPDFAPAQKQLARLYSHQPGKLDRALTLATQARASFPGDPQVSKTYGIILYQQNNFSRAAEALRDSATQIQGDGELLFYLGSAQFQLKRFPESKATLQQALTLNLTPQQTDAAKKMLAQIK